MKYRITLVYSVIVTIILALLCVGVYFVSLENREALFKKRMVRKAQSSVELLRTGHIDSSMLRVINETSSSLLYDKSVSVYDDKGHVLFMFSDMNIPSVQLTKALQEKVQGTGVYFFKYGYRDAVCVLYGHGNNTYYALAAAYDNDREEWIGFLRLILLGGFLIGVAVTIVSGYIFSLRLVSSISALTNRLDSITTREFSTRLDAGENKDELQQLSTAINGLLDRLQTSFDTQRRFIDNASHELSTPLTVIHSQLDVALQKERAATEYKRVLESVKDDVKGLGFLVRNLLELAKASGSQKGIELSFVRLDELLMRVRTDIKRISPLYEVNLVFDAGMEDATDMGTYGNEHLLYSAIRNIVHNACKFSPDKKADVSLAIEGKYILIFVEDTGPGIPAEELKLIFQPFYRVGKDESKITGSGLGLALAYHIVRLHKGDISVQSELGHGASFKIVLPVISA